jgi:pimeloyl-ACP methyl ester carboxylesterase
MPDAPAQDALPLETPPHPEPFVAPASAAALEDLRARLRATRWPDAPEDAGWSLGTDLDYLRELVAYWADEFDWPAQEAALARLPRFRVALGDLRIHFVHARAVGAAGTAVSSKPALPLVLSHGWPDSFWRYSKVIPLLTDPGAHGADPADAFDVVVPDMPGYGYSDHPAGLPFDSIGVAGLWAELMSVLGYERFGAAGGDIGSGVSRYLALDQPDRVVAVHRMDVGLPVFTGDPAELTGEERAFLDRTAAWGAAEGAYAAMHRTKPQTAAFGLTDSPAGLAAWIVEKLRAWSDCGGDVERSFSRDEILTNVTLYWLTGTIGSSMRMYHVNGAIPLAQHARRVEVPSGFSLFPGDLAQPPRAWLERVANVVRVTKPDRGGHFAPIEEPELYAAELREFFRPYRAAVASAG